MSRLLVWTFLLACAWGCGETVPSGSEPTVSRPDPTRFAESPGRFQGQTIQVTGVVVPELGLADGKPLTAAAGSSLKLTCQGESKPFEVVIHLPPTLEPLPPAKAGDEVIVAFTCADGRLTEGNTAVRVGLSGP